jgi:hypothetical protein
MTKPTTPDAALHARLIRRGIDAEIADHYDQIAQLERLQRSIKVPTATATRHEAPSSQRSAVYKAAATFDQPRKRKVMSAAARRKIGRAKRAWWKAKKAAEKGAAQ